jgi:hypothetical protein
MEEGLMQNHIGGRLASYKGQKLQRERQTEQLSLGETFWKSAKEMARFTLHKTGL